MFGWRTRNPLPRSLAMSEESGDVCYHYPNEVPVSSKYKPPAERRRVLEETGLPAVRMGAGLRPTRSRAQQMALGQMDASRRGRRLLAREPHRPAFDALQGGCVACPPS